MRARHLHRWSWPALVVLAVALAVVIAAGNLPLHAETATDEAPEEPSADAPPAGPPDHGPPPMAGASDRIGGRPSRGSDRFDRSRGRLPPPPRGEFGGRGEGGPRRPRGDWGGQGGEFDGPPSHGRDRSRGGFDDRDGRRPPPRREFDDTDGRGPRRQHGEFGGPGDGPSRGMHGGYGRPPGPPPPRDPAQAFDHMDSDGDGTLSREEFIEFHEQHRPPHFRDEDRPGPRGHGAEDQ